MNGNTDGNTGKIVGEQAAEGGKQDGIGLCFCHMRDMY